MKGKGEADWAGETGGKQKETDRDQRDYALLEIKSLQNPRERGELNG